MPRIFLILSAFLILFSCKEKTSQERIPVEPDGGIGDGASPLPVFSFADNIEEAHNKEAFRTREAVSFDILLKFGDKVRLDAEVSMTTNSTRVRMDKTDGTSIIFDGEQVAMIPATADDSRARFDVFTWQYFFAMPFKLTDPGTIWDEPQLRILDSTRMESAKLSFEGQTGDSPDDWYIVYKSPETERLKAAAYIVTFNREKAKAEKEPHAIVYSDYQMIENVAFSTKWSFHDWSSETGLGKKLGEASITNIRFFNPEEEHFKIPDGAKQVSR